jgi:hypothetical protein
MRFRFVFMGFGAAAVMGALLATDPDGGLMTGMLLMALATPVLAVAFAHLARRGLFDYLDLERVAGEAQKGPTGAGLVFVGVCIVIAALLALFGRSAQAATVGPLGPLPPRAAVYLPVLSAEIDARWSNVPQRSYLAGLVHHESGCPALRSKCWNPTSQLKTHREEGAGLGQLTRAWRPDGSLRFDALAEMRQQHPALRELSWPTIYQRPDLQLRAVVLKVRSDFAALAAVPDRMERLRFADAAYNGGLGGLQRERRACQVKAGCDPSRWFGHVEHTCLKSRAPLYGSRSACDINRHHVVVVFRDARLYEGVV